MGCFHCGMIPADEDLRSAYFDLIWRNVLNTVQYFSIDFVRLETVMLCTNPVLLHSYVSQLQLKQDVLYFTAMCTKDCDDLSFPIFNRQ